MEEMSVEVPVEAIPVETTSSSELLSKNQRKKLLRKQKFEEKKHVLRKAEKERRKLKNAIAREQGIERGPSRKELKKIKKDPADFNIAIDLSFDELMSEKDLASCAKQLLRIYTSNRRGIKPIPLHFTSFSESGKLYKQMERHEGWKNWEVSSHEKSYLEVFEKDKIVYLTSESDNVLDKLETGACYVIGGLVDHNHHKSLTLDLAEKQSIRTARLPLSENLIMKTRSVLTINQVFDIILGVADGNSWKEVLLQNLPQRKKIQAREDEADGEPESKKLKEENTECQEKSEK